jgi:hypothetical protein
MEKQNPCDKFDASDFVSLALSPIPSAFGRLVLLADLRDNHDELADMLYGKDQIDEAIREKHREIFIAWLGLSPAKKTAEVAAHLADQGGSQKAVLYQLIQQWLQGRLYERLRPTGASDSEHRLFSSVLGAILQSLQARLGSSEESHGC